MDECMATSHEKLIASNSIARHHYTLSDRVEAGIALVGTEAKSLRENSPQLKETFIEVVPRGEGFEAWLLNLHIHPYRHGNIWNHEPLRKRKLLLHAHQLKKLYSALIQKGMTLIPLKLYFKSNRVKVEIALGRGKKEHDKRQAIKEKEVNRDIQRAMKQR